MVDRPSHHVITVYIQQVVKCLQATQRFERAAGCLKKKLWEFLGKSSPRSLSVFCVNIQ